jgi:hypothetical protein
VHRYLGVLAFVDLLQVHLWIAIGFGIVLTRRWKTRWIAIGLASAFYVTVTAVFGRLPFFPSAYLLIALSLLVDRGAPEGAAIARAYAVGLASLAVLACLLPSGVAWAASRRR